MAEQISQVRRLDDCVHWSFWYIDIRNYAKSLGVWEYCAFEGPNMRKLTPPPDTTTTNNGTHWLPPSRQDHQTLDEYLLEQIVFTQRCLADKRTQEQREEYEQKRKKLYDVVAVIRATISPVFRAFVEDCELPHELLAELAQYAYQTPEAHVAYIDNRVRALEAGGHRDGLEWASEWTDILTFMHTARRPPPGFSEVDLCIRFVNACRTRMPKFYTLWANRMQTMPQGQVKLRDVTKSYWAHIYQRSVENCGVSLRSVS